MCRRGRAEKNADAFSDVLDALTTWLDAVVPPQTRDLDFFSVVEAERV